MFVIFVFFCFNAAAPAAPFNRARENDTDTSVAVQYLRDYGYLDGPAAVSGKASLVKESTRLSRNELVEAVSRLQAFANLNVSGVLDAPTARLMRTRRCGLRDPASVVRERRSANTRRVWDDVKNITWWSEDVNRFTHPGASSPYFSRAVLGALQKAFDVWSRDTPAEFSRADDGRIRISFGRLDHGCGYDFDGAGKVLAHAFLPNGDDETGGDIHFDSDENWSFDVNDGGGDDDDDEVETDFFLVALHEIGHAVGLGHSSDPSALMYPWYKTDVLKADAPNLPAADSLAFYELYAGNLDAATTVAGERDEAEDRNRCVRVYGPYDDITYIRNHLFVVKDGLVWRWNRDRSLESERKINDYFQELPTDRHVDALHYDERADSVIVVTGDHLFQYVVATFPLPLKRRVSVRHDLGVFTRGPVDTVFAWRGNETYMFTGRHYWSLDVQKLRARYVGRVADRWPGMLDRDYNAAFTHDRRTYFVKNNWRWEVNATTGGPVSYRQAVGSVVPGCEHHEALRRGSGGRETFRVGRMPATSGARQTTAVVVACLVTTTVVLPFPHRR